MPAENDHGEALHTVTQEEPFDVPVGDGVLSGHRGGEGPSALVLHGGPGMADYTEELAAELGDVFATIRYTQRGIEPSTVGGPYNIESHASDALAVLDHFGIERAWAVGHSWGGHLALHMAVAHPERLLGVIAVDTLGAYAIFEEFAENLCRRLPAEQRARAEEIGRLRDRGEATREEVRERFTILFPQYFADPASVTQPPPRTAPECSRDTHASIREHFERGTLLHGLPGVRLPMLFIHGALDPLPLWSADRTASLVPGARLEAIPDCAHFPWWERPGEIGRSVGEWLEAG